MTNETALICRRFLSPLFKAVKMHVILFFNKIRTRQGGREGVRTCVCVCVCVCVFASAMFVNAIQQC